MKVTIERTSKGVKLLQLVAVGLLVIGVLRLSLGMFLLGLGVALVADVARWWHNG